MMRLFKTTIGVILSLGFMVSAAQALEEPTGQVILTVSGAIEYSNSQNGASFDGAMLKSLDQAVITTNSPWTEGAATYKGPSLKAVLDVVGAKGKTLKVVALNDYAAEVPAADAEDHNPILAMERDGKMLRIRDKGPLFLVYPFDDKPELDNEMIYNRSVWQIKAIVVED